MQKQLIALFACLFVVSVGYGITLPVLTFYIERLALADGNSSQQVAVHVGALTGVFALMQFFFAPLWGKLSDRVGRRPLVVVGLSGYALTNVLFGLSTNLFMLYTARILGGLLSAAVLPAATAYVADVTSENERGKGMAWLGSAVGLGVVVGPALGAGLSKLDWPFSCELGHFYLDDFSVPFFAAALLAVLSLISAVNWLQESVRVRQRDNTEKPSEARIRLGWIRAASAKLLAMSFLGQFALTLFEGTFALHASRLMNFGPREMGLVFMVCGVVMAGAQATIVGQFISRLSEKKLLSAGFGLMGLGLMLLMTAQTLAFILAYVALFALGMAAINPSIAALVSKRAGKNSGAVLGWQNAVNSLGQASGPLVGGLLLGWYIHVPYLLAALPLISTAVFLGRKTWLRN